VLGSVDSLMAYSKGKDDERALESKRTLFKGFSECESEYRRTSESSIFGDLSNFAKCVDNVFRMGTEANPKV
jgi:hypothetical protein